MTAPTTWELKASPTEKKQQHQRHETPTAGLTIIELSAKRRRSQIKRFILLCA